MVEAFFETLFQIAIRVPGYYSLRCFYRATDLNFDSDLVLVVGLVVFLAVVGLTIALVLWLR